MSLRIPISILVFTVFTSCVKQPQDVPEPYVDIKGNGILILNEGTWNQNNASLTFYNTEGVTKQQVYENRNAEKLGDVANDMKQYGGKLYIVVNESSNLVIVNARTLHLIKRIPLFDGGKARSPRNIIFHEGKGYLTAFDGTVHRLDTTSLVIDKMTTAGRNPEGLVVQNGKLYVSNSGGLDYPNYDNTVSVIDLATFQEIKKITVGMNPGGLAADAEGDVYVVARGNHEDVLSQLVRIDATTDQVKESLSNKVFSIKIVGDNAFVSYNNASFSAPELRRFDPVTETIADTLFTDLSSLSGYYGFDIIDEGVTCFDAKDFTTKGETYWFNKHGKLIQKIPSGFVPSTAIKKEF